MERLLAQTALVVSRPPLQELMQRLSQVSDLQRWHNNKHHACILHPEEQARAKAAGQGQRFSAHFKKRPISEFRNAMGSVQAASTVQQERNPAKTQHL